MSTAHNIRATGLCRVSGRHLSEAPNDGDLTAADLREIDESFLQRADANEPSAAVKADREADRTMAAEHNYARCVRGE